MTEDERRLLLYVSRWLAENLEEQAGKRGATDNLAVEIRKLVEKVRPK